MDTTSKRTKRGKRRVGLATLLLAAVAPLAACGGGGAPDAPTPPLQDEPMPLPVRGTATTLDIGSWNLEWFGDPESGPGDEELQMANVRALIDALEVDLWSVQEVVDGGRFDALLADLDGYSGFVADDDIVAEGARYYSDFDGNELKVGIIYRDDLFAVRDARVILGEHEWEFSGRPPVEVRLGVDTPGGTTEIVVILLHAKSGSDVEDWERRMAASVALKSYLDTAWPDTPVTVVGDFNDDVDSSITGTHDSPYANFVNDADDYLFVTAPLSETGQRSMVTWPNVIDHHLITDELVEEYVDGSAEIFPAGAYFRYYGETTTDHYPVLVRYRLLELAHALRDGGSGGRTPPLH